MKKHRSKDALQTEIRKLENRYANLFSRSDLKGLVLIKKKLDELKLELSELQCCNERIPEEGSSVVYNGQPATKIREASRQAGFETKLVSRKGSGHSMAASSANVLPSFLQFKCPQCNAELSFSSTGAKAYECIQGHAFSKEELENQFSEKIQLALREYRNSIGELNDNVGRLPAIGQRIEILQNVLGLINRSLK